MTSEPDQRGEEPERSVESVFIDRRAYLKATGGITGLSFAGSGVAAASETTETGEESTLSPPTNLRVEYEHEPNNLEPSNGDNDPPRFSWVGESSSRGSEQTAYEIIVTRTEEDAEDGDGTVWDSGKVESSQSTNVPYGGSSLAPDRTYYWRVRTWDQDDTASEWSSVATFTTAIPGTGDYWEGSWLGADLDPIESPEGHEQEVSPNPLFRKTFSLDGDVARARLHISGLGYNVPYLNGERVGDNVLDPATTDYEETVLFTTYDVTESMQEGENALGVALGRSRYGEPLENTWFWDDTPWWSDPELLVQLNVRFADGSTTTVVTDDTWRTSDGPTRYDSLFDGEEYDAREAHPGWTETSYDDGEWDEPVLVDGPTGALEPQRTPPVRVQETVSPVSRSNPEEGVYVFDLGVMIAGWTRLTVEGSEGDEVRISMGEKLHDDGTVLHSWGPGYPEPIQEDTYILSGDGTETWEASFTYKGFRYVQIEGYPGTPTADDLEGVVVHTDLESENESEFSCSNDLLNQIQENTRRALLNNHHGVPQDTPKYEKNGWTGDAQATAATALYNFDMARFYQKWFRDMRDAQLGTGEVPVIVPTSDWSYEDEPGWPAVQGPTPAWDASYFIMPWLMYTFNGDRRLLEKHYEPMKRYLDWFEGYFDGYVPEMGLGDWVAPGENEVPIVATAYYYRELDIVSKVAAVLGHDGESTVFEERRDAVADAFNDRFYDSDAGYYGTSEVETYVQTSNVLPLAFGMVPDDRVDTVVEALVRDIQEEHDGHLFTGLYGTKHILPVLSEHGHHDVAYTIATQTTYPSWGHWIENGLTALLEEWSLEARSRDHHFLGSISEWFYQYLAGVREPAGAGFEQVEIAPKPVDDLTAATGRVDTVRGQIVSEWERTEDELSLRVSIPWNSSGTVRVPTLGGDKVRVRESGKTVWNNWNQTRPNHEGVGDITREGDEIVVEVGSGEYHFELEQLGS